jgi:hypothetical protein
MSTIVVVILIYRCHKLTDSINLLGSYRRRNVFLARYAQSYKVEFQIKDRAMDKVQNCDSYIRIPSQTYISCSFLFPPVTNPEHCFYFLCRTHCHRGMIYKTKLLQYVISQVIFRHSVWLGMAATLYITYELASRSSSAD